MRKFWGRLIRGQDNRPADILNRLHISLAPVSPLKVMTVWHCV